MSATAGTSRVNKFSSPIDNFAQQDTLPSTNIHPTTEPSTPTHVNAEENNNDQAEFTNPFCTPVQEVAESSSHNIDGFVDPNLQKKVYLQGKHYMIETSSNEYGMMKTLQISDVQGLQIHQSLRDIFINQAKYALEILKKHGMEKGQSIGKPMATKPKLDADLSGEPAEYVTLSASCAQVMWMRTQLKDYGFNYNKIPLYCDSQSAIAISCNPLQHSRTKHIHTRYHFIKEQVENGIIELYFVRTEYQLADMFTKALPEDRFQYLVIRIGMRCLTPA
ncbi:hypothetical protein Tco_0617826 [Tanacetum coccineum]